MLTDKQTTLTLTCTWGLLTHLASRCDMHAKYRYKHPFATQSQVTTSTHSHLTLTPTLQLSSEPSPSQDCAQHRAPELKGLYSTTSKLQQRCTRVSNTCAYTLIHTCTRRYQHVQSNLYRPVWILFRMLLITILPMPCSGGT